MSEDRISQIAVAARLKPGDWVLVGGEPKAIATVKRAAGRKPAKGENLHLLTQTGELIRVNSTQGVRVPLPKP